MKPLRELEQAATPRPWHAAPVGYNRGNRYATLFKASSFVEPNVAAIHEAESPDADLIVTLRNLAPEINDVLDAAKAIAARDTQWRGTTLHANNVGLETDYLVDDLKTLFDQLHNALARLLAAEERE
jgi:hypothetical protein